jgi:hypothetical protein
VLTDSIPATDEEFMGLDVAESREPKVKAQMLRQCAIQAVRQAKQAHNPDARIVLGESAFGKLLTDYADSYVGLQTGDTHRFIFDFWEVSEIRPPWQVFQLTSELTTPRFGKSGILFWEDGRGELQTFSQARIQGTAAWDRKGVLVRLMRHLPCTLYDGELFDQSSAAIIPRHPEHLPAIWLFCSSPEFHAAVRRLDQKSWVTNATLVKVPFDLNHWRSRAAEEYPSGLPDPFSNDPTQWIFRGHPQGSTDPPQVAVARLLGYRWPDQEPDSLDPGACGTAAPGGPDYHPGPAGGGWATSKLIDADGIVPIPAVRGEPPAAERLREVLKAAFGSEWSASREHEMMTEAGARPGTTLDDWLRNNFFEQHYKMFHNRPFIWHIWDGRRDGFSCLVNYHKLTHKLLDNLTHSYVQDWINLQAADARSGRTGADLRLAAAQALQEELKLILAGEPPYDIFVRWKPLSQQPIGWNPDLNYGVRMNIRPFVEAGILRKNPNIKWTKDRGKEPKRPKNEYPWFWEGDTFKGDRVNNVHLTNQQKMNARSARP